MTDITIRPMREGDLPEVGRIARLAFGTFLGIPDPDDVFPGTDFTTRWHTDPESAFVAEVEGGVAGSNFATIWGSFGFFGPLTVRPDLWDQGVGKQLMEPIMNRFASMGAQHLGLFTFAQSPKHIALYGKFGFWPRFLTALMGKAPAASDSAGTWERYSQLPAAGKNSALAEARDLTGAIYPGLDVGVEIKSVDAQHLGDTLLLRDGSLLAGLAICHCGPGSEGGNGTCYVKFAAVRPDSRAGDNFDRLLDACETFAAGQGLGNLMAGVNLAREDAYRRMVARGFRTAMQGVAMHRPNEPAFNRPGVYVIDDWR